MKEIIPERVKAIVIEDLSYLSRIARRRRNEIFLILGLSMGADSGNAIRNRGEMCDPPDPVAEEITEMPSVCDLRKGTFFEDSKELNNLCEAAKIDSKDENCPSYGLERLRSRIRKMKSYAIGFTNCGLVQEEVEKGTENEKVSKKKKKNIPESEVKERYQLLEAMPEPYRTLLEKFDPEAFKAFKNSTYVSKNNCEVEEDINGAAGDVKGPLSLVEGKFVTSENGKYYLVRLSEGLLEIDLEQVIFDKDREKIYRLIKSMYVLAHEIYGHMRIGMEPIKCNEEGAVFKLRHELYSYYIGAKMTAYLMQSYPALNDLFTEDIAKYKQRHSRWEKMNICQIKKEEEGESCEDGGILGEYGVEGESYIQAAKTGNWRDLKDSLFIANVMYLGWPYILAYHRLHNGQEDFEKFNRALGVIMNEDSPENLFRK